MRVHCWEPGLGRSPCGASDDVDATPPLRPSCAVVVLVTAAVVCRLGITIWGPLSDQHAAKRYCWLCHVHAKNPS